MRIADDEVLLKWLTNVREMGAGHFLSHVVAAALHADDENSQLMYPLLKKLQEKYPKYDKGR